MSVIHIIAKMQSLSLLLAVCLLLFSIGHAGEKATMEVRVTDYTNGKPISKAILSLQQMDIDEENAAHPDRESNSDGVIVFHNLQPGLYTISVCQLYYKTLKFDVFVSGSEKNNVTIQLMRDYNSFVPVSLSRKQEAELSEKVRRIRKSEFSTAKDWGESWIIDERGRVFLDYGTPDEIISQPDMSLELHSKGRIYDSVVIWLYYDGGYPGMTSIYDGPHFGTTKFVFVDKAGYGKFTLLYSSAPGEVSDPRVFRNRTFY